MTPPPGIDPLRPSIRDLRILNPKRAWEMLSSYSRTRSAMGWRGGPRRPPASSRPPGSRAARTKKA
jgi:hypothetical protein